MTEVKVSAVFKGQHQLLFKEEVYLIVNLKKPKL